MKKIFVTSVLSACMIAGSSFAGLADISFGSASAAGAGTFFGTDGNAADSISIGYFSGAANAELTTGLRKVCLNKLIVAMAR
jgi:hypothetical protein